MNRLILALVMVAFSIRTGVGGTEQPAISCDEIPWNASLSTGWDSLYMYRGVNQLPGYEGYGSSISWTALSVTLTPTSSDSFTLASWAAFGIDESDYKEVDATAEWAHAFGALTVTAGYALYAVLSNFGGLYSNELTASATYDIMLGPATLSPGLLYAFTLGPEPEARGYISSGVGYLETRVDGTLPLWNDVITLAPWIAAGFSFGYNSRETEFEEAVSFTGADHLEAGLALPIALSDVVTLSPYVAWSHAWTNLVGTRPDTSWGGIYVNFSF